MKLLWEQCSSSVICDVALSWQELAGDLLGDASQVQLPIVTARPVRVVVVVGLQCYPLLDLGQLCCVTKDVSEGSLQDLLFGDWTQAIGIDVRVEKSISVLQSLELNHYNESSRKL